MAIGVSRPSFHAALIGFGILYSPISEITGLAMNFLSRKFEYEADDCPIAQLLDFADDNAAFHRPAGKQDNFFTRLLNRFTSPSKDAT